MGYFDDMLKEMTQERWETYTNTKIDPHHCNFSEGGECKSCMHPLDCPLDNQTYIREQKRLHLEYDLGQWKELLTIVINERQALGLPLEGVLPNKEPSTRWKNPYYQKYPNGTWLDDPNYSPESIRRRIYLLEKELKELEE